MWRGVPCCPRLDLWGCMVRLQQLLTGDDCTTTAAAAAATAPTSEDRKRRQHTPASAAATTDAFSDKQKRLLRHSWQTLGTEKLAKGTAIFRYIFAHRPDAKALFPFRGLSDEALSADPLFRSHAMRFMHAVDTTIASLDNLDLALVPILHDLGKYHGSVAGFRLDFLPVFTAALLTVFSDELGTHGWTADVSSAWTVLVSFIAEKITEGVLEAENRHTVAGASGMGVETEAGPGAVEIRHGAESGAGFPAGSAVDQHEVGPGPGNINAVGSGSGETVDTNILKGVSVDGLSGSGERSHILSDSSTHRNYNGL